MRANIQSKLQRQPLKIIRQSGQSAIAQDAQLFHCHYLQSCSRGHQRDQPIFENRGLRRGWVYEISKSVAGSHNLQGECGMGEGGVRADGKGKDHPVVRENDGGDACVGDAPFLDVAAEEIEEAGSNCKRMRSAATRSGLGATASTCQVLLRQSPANE